MTTQDLTISLGQVPSDKVDFIKNVIDAFSKSMNFKIKDISTKNSTRQLAQGIAELETMANLFNEAGITVSDEDIKNIRAKRYE